MKQFFSILFMFFVTISVIAQNISYVAISGDWKFNNGIASEYSDKADLNNRPKITLAALPELYNGSVSVDVTTLDGVGDIYLIGRWQNINNYYALKYSDPHNKLTLLKVVNGNVTVLAEQEKSVEKSPKVATLKLTLKFAGNWLYAIAGDTTLKGFANNFSHGASGVGVRFRQADFSNFTIERNKDNSSENLITSTPLKNNLFPAEDDITLSLDFKNTTNKNFSNLKIECEIPPSIKFAWNINSLEPNQTINLKKDIKTNTLKSGEYQLSYKIFDKDDLIYASEENFAVLPYRNKNRFEQMLWDNIDDNNELKRLGFTVAGSNFYFTSHFANRGEEYAQETANSLKSFEDRLALGIDSILKIDSQRFWDKKKYDELFMKDNKNKNQLSGHVCNNHLEFKKIRDKSLVSLGEKIKNNHALKYVLYDSETENEERKLFQCTHKDCLAKADNEKFNEEKLVANRPWTMVGASLFHNPKKVGVKSDGTIPDNIPIFNYIKWWWLDGSGFVNNRQEMAEIMAKYLPKSKSFHDPLLRNPAFLGRAKGLDFVSQWTYTNPSPLSVIENIDELSASVDNSKAIVPDIQLFWYTNEVIGNLKNKDDLKRQAAEANSVVEARDAIHYGRFVTISPDNLKESVWLAMSRPIDALMLDGGSCISNTPGTYAYTNTATPEALEQINKQLVAPYGAMLKFMDKTPKKVAMLQSVYSSLFGRTGNYGNANKEFADWYNSVILAQVQPDIIFDEQLNKLSEYDVLIIGDTKFLSDSAFAKISNFAKSNKLVIVDPKLEVNIPNSVKFDITLTDKLNAKEQALAWQNNSKKLRSILSEHNYKWDVSSNKDSVVIAQRIGDGDQSVFIINDLRKAGNYVGQYGKVLEQIVPQNIELKFSNDIIVNKKVIYDCLARKEVTLDSNNSANFFIRDGKLLYIASSRIIDMTTLLSSKEINRGEVLQLSINLKGEKELLGSQAIKLTIRDSDGIENDFSGYYSLVNGKLTLNIPIAKNDLKGHWHIIAEDLIANFKSENSFLVK